jgi:hypothetical protein
MSASGGMKREIVVEVEQVRRIRKRIASQLRYCTECRNHVDFISIKSAAQIFERDEVELVHFIRSVSCHTQMQAAEIHICLIAFLEAIKARSIGSRSQINGDITK